MAREKRLFRHPVLGRAGLLIITLTLTACFEPDLSEPEQEVQQPREREGRTLRLGDIDPDTPARRTHRLQPLAGYLAEQLADLGIARGRVVIARDMNEMGRLLSQGDVDLYLDSVHPTLVVQERSNSRILLRCWAQGAAEYRALIVSSAESGIDSLEQLRGSVLALQEEYSTSGYLLPAGTLVEMGFELTRVGGPDERPTADKVHYFFTRDEENMIELVRTGRVAAGAISNQEYERLTPGLRDSLRVLGETESAPRQLLSVSADLETTIVEGISDVLLDLAGPGERPVALEDSPQAWTWKFDEITPESLDHLRALARLLETP